MTTHLHWIVWAYRDHDTESGNYIDNTPVDVVADTWSDALKRAEKLMPKSLKGNGRGCGYRIAQVVEHLDGFCK